MGRRFSMQKSVTARHFDLTPEIKDRAEAEMEGLTRFFDHIISAEFVLGVEKRRRLAELNVKIPNHKIICKGETEDMVSAMEVAVDKVKGQLRKYKGKMKNRRPEEINEVMEAVTRPATDPDEVDV
jgi:putative sigma-54 modulation protein